MTNPDQRALIKLLIVEYSADDAGLVGHWLKPLSQWQVRTVQRLSEAIRELENSEWDLVFLDLNLPDSTGPGSIAKIRSLSPCSGLIVLTSSSELETAISALKLGADDYLIKCRINPDICEKSIHYVLDKKRAENAMSALRQQHSKFEQALNEEFHKFQSLFENALDGIVIADDNKQYIDANPAACAIFGLTREELLKRKVTDFIDPDFLPEALGTWDEFRNSKSQRGTIGIRASNGEKKLLEYSATADTHPGKHISILRDVTGIRAIKEERDRFFSVALDMICIADMQGRFVLMNPACQTILGYTPEEMCSRPILDFIHPGDVQATTEKLAEIIDGKTVSAFENRYKAKNGNYVQLAWKSVTIGDRIYATARDMTERNNLHAQLLHADRMVAVGTLAAGVAHEINNPLAYTLANLQLALDELDTAAGPLLPEKASEIREMLKLAATGASRVKDVVSGLKLFSRNDEEQSGPVKLEAVMDLSIRMARHEIEPRAEIEIRYGETPLVKANEGRLGQVFLNILINAAQAIPEGKAADNKITITTKKDSSGNACIEVQDTGAGIPDHIKDRIFDPFFTTKPIGTGTGLGLSICHGIITAAGGKIKVESRKGKGTLIRITLPASSLSAEPTKSEIAVAPSISERLKVVLIDDEEIFAATIASALKKHHEVEVFTDSAEALKHIMSDAKFNVILCDLMMPNFTGMDIYEQLLNAKDPDLHKRIIYMTGGAFTPRSTKFLQNNEIKRIEKPFRIPQLLELIKTSSFKY